MTRRKKDLLEALPLRIAYSVDYRGADDDQPVFVFIGATGEALVAAFRWICRGGHAARGFRLNPETAPVWRNGHAYRRHVVTLLDPHYDFCSLTDLQTLIEARLQAQGHQATFVQDYNKFINL